MGKDFPRFPGEKTATFPWLDFCTILTTDVYSDKQVSVQALGNGSRTGPEKGFGVAMDRSAVAKRVLLTVGVEDYFQVGSFDGLIQRENWYRFETRIARNTRKALDLFDDFGIQATFFVLGCVADAMPEVVREIARRGHEVASGGYWHRTIQQMTPEEFRDDLKRSREALERATGACIFGHRVAHVLRPQYLWDLD